MYRFEKTTGGQDLIIDGFEKGIADSPFQGIGNIRNLNVSYYSGVAYVNYKRKPATITGGTLVFPRFACQSPAGIIYISDENGQIFKQTALNGSTFALLTGNSNNAGSNGIQFWNNYLFAWTSSEIDICGDGTGDAGVTSSNWNTAAGTGGVWPIAFADLTLTGSPSGGDTSATISTYTDAKGNSRAFWNGPTGTYVGYSGSGKTGNKMSVSLTQGSTAVTWTPSNPASFGGSHLYIFPLDSAGYFHSSLVSINTGDLYFCNNSTVGSLNANNIQKFDKTNFNSFTFNASALTLPNTETSVCMTELNGQLLVASYFKIYTWDFISLFSSKVFPMQEQVFAMINILNNVYILAGNKGNIYLSNGYSASPFKKLPDNIAGVIDPSWQWMRTGGIMGHRLKLYVQALAVNAQTGVPILAGIFSLGLVSGNGVTSETAGTLVMEAQNSFGLASSSTTNNGILIDNPPNISNGVLNYDNYYSAWANGGADAGGIDFNDTTLWSSNEAIIETDIIPIGTSVVPKTFSSMEFKLDQPMQSGDSITVYARQSLSNSYTQIGTTTTAVLSDFYTPMPVQSWQWIQFKITISCNATATSSSFVPIREIRIR